MAENENTAEVQSAYVAALLNEKASVEARVAALGDGKYEARSSGELAERIGYIDAELKRVQPSAKKAGKAK